MMDSMVCSLDLAKKQHEGMLMSLWLMHVRFPVTKLAHDYEVNSLG
jgi:hypothetical protein